MPRQATVAYRSLHTSLLNLPPSVYSQLVSNGLRPQGIVVSLTLPDGRDVWLGWSGMVAAVVGHWQGGGSGDEGVEMDAKVAEGLGITEGIKVTIGLHPALPSASTVNITPLSPDDWEILEKNADYVESNLLSQVRAAATSQPLTVYLPSSTTLRFRVDSTEPETSPERVPAVRLDRDTEVIIAPSLRRPASAAPSGESESTVVPTRKLNEEQRAEGSGEAEGGRRLYRLLPARHHTLPSDPLTILVSSSTFSTFFPGRKRKGALATLRHISRPNAPRAPKATAQEESVPGPMGLNLKDKEEASSEVAWGKKPVEDGVAEDAEQVLRELVLRVVASDKVPERHFALSARVRSKVIAEDFELFHVRPAPPHSEVSDIHSSPRPAAPSATTQPTSLPGFADLLDRSVSHVLQALVSTSPHLFPHVPGRPGAGPRRASGLLITGSSGAGKTSLARLVASTLSSDPAILTDTIHQDLSSISAERIPVIREKLQGWLDLAAWRAPAVLVLDNLDRLVPPELEHGDPTRPRQIAEHFVSLFGPSSDSLPEGVVILATASGPAALHPLLGTAHVFGERVSLRAPDKDARREILEHLVSVKLEGQVDPDLNYVSVATQTEGYLPADLRDLVDRAAHQAAIRSARSNHEATLLLAAQDFEEAQRDFAPLSLRDVKLHKSDVEWKDIGGLEETRRTLRETLEWPTKYAAIFKSCPLRLRSGLLLYGYPGCGKTLLASAVAKECGLNFISVKGPELLNKYIGASEASVRDLFERASAAKPCVLFFDEFDSIAPKRGHDSTGVTDRVVNQMLTQMDGAEGLEGVYVLAATSRPDLIDPALLRPGRLDKSLLCNMPDEAERLDILTALVRKLAISPSVSLDNFAARTEGYSGADLQALLYNAHLETIHTALDGVNGIDADVEKENQGSDNVDFEVYDGVDGPADGGNVMSRAEEGAMQKRLEVMLVSARSAKRGKPSTQAASAATRSKPHIENAHLERALSLTRPSVSVEERLRLDRIYGEFVSGRSGEFPSGQASGEIGGRTSLM